MKSIIQTFMNYLYISNFYMMKCKKYVGWISWFWFNIINEL